MLERVTDFMAHPETLFAAGREEDPAERFLQVSPFAR